MTNNPPSAQIKPGEYGFPLKLKARYDGYHEFTGKGYRDN